MRRIKSGTHCALTCGFNLLLFCSATDSGGRRGKPPQPRFRRTKPPFSNWRPRGSWRARSRVGFPVPQKCGRCGRWGGYRRLDMGRGAGDNVCLFGLRLRRCALAKSGAPTGRRKSWERKACPLISCAEMCALICSAELCGKVLSIILSMSAILDNA